MRVLLAFLLCFVGCPVIAQTISNAQPNSSSQFAEQLKELNTRFTKATAEKRDYQEIREIRADIKKLIPAIRSLADETFKQNQIDENVLNGEKRQLSYFLGPRVPAGFTPSIESPFPTSSIFPPEDYANSVDALKRLQEDLKRTLPGQIDGYTKKIAEIDKEREGLAQALNDPGVSQEQKQAMKERLAKLEFASQPLSQTKTAMEAQQQGLDGVVQRISDLMMREKSLSDRKSEQAVMQKIAVDADNLLDFVRRPRWIHYHRIFHRRIKG
jgi:hypothetical protein